MSRKRFFLAGLASSYALIGLNLLCTVFSVPLTLHYLTKTEFGLWALVAQFSGYLLLLDMGVSASVSRLLADHKDDKQGLNYARVFFSYFFVSAIQATVLFTIGATAAFFVPSIAGVSETFRPVFTHLLLFQSAITAISLAFRGLGSPLWSHARLDINNLGNGLGLIANFFGFWIGLHAGWGLYGMLWGTCLGFFPPLISTYLACRRLDYYPQWPGWKAIRSADFQALFRFSRDIFLFQLGSQMASATQIVLVSRFISVESAAIWAVATKSFVLGQQLCNRIFDSSSAALAEMYIRGEMERFSIRFRQVFQLTSWFACVVATIIIFLNTPIIAFWTGGKITWPVENNFGLALLLLTTCSARCFWGLGGLTKRTAILCWLQILEAVAMILLSCLFISRFGFMAVLFSSVFANFFITLLLSQKLATQFLGTPFRALLSWNLPVFLFILICVFMMMVIGRFIFFCKGALNYEFLILFTCCFFLVLGSAKLCLRSETKIEIQRFFKKAFGRDCFFLR